jgi:large subunit ribosomal protein L21e
MASKKAKGKRAKTRNKLTRKQGKLTINKILPDFETGETVQVVIDSAVHSGMPHSRFHGLTGKVTGKQGKVYSVELKKGDKDAELFVHPAHLKVVKNLEKSSDRVAA